MDRETEDLCDFDERAHAADEGGKLDGEALIHLILRAEPRIFCLEALHIKEFQLQYDGNDVALRPNCASKGPQKGKQSDRNQWRKANHNLEERAKERGDIGPARRQGAKELICLLAVAAVIPSSKEIVVVVDGAGVCRSMLTMLALIGLWCDGEVSRSSQNVSHRAKGK